MFTFGKKKQDFVTRDQHLKIFLKKITREI